MLLRSCVGGSAWGKTAPKRSKRTFQAGMYHHCQLRQSHTQCILVNKRSRAGSLLPPPLYLPHMLGLNVPTSTHRGGCHIHRISTLKRAAITCTFISLWMPGAPGQAPVWEDQCRNLSKKSDHDNIWPDKKQCEDIKHLHTKCVTNEPRKPKRLCVDYHLQ